MDRAGPDLFGFLDGAQSAESVPIKAGRPALTGAEWKEQAVRGQRLRAFVLVLLSLLAAGVFAVVARQSWTTSSADVRLVQDERARVAYLRPLSHLVGALTEAQSAAVRAAPADTPAVQSAVEAVDAVDREYGDALDAAPRWDDLRRRINLTVAKPATGRPGYESFADVLTLTLDLVRRIGNTSDLIRDPRLDSYYVLDTALLRLPEAVVSAGRAADLALLAGKSTLSGADAVQAAVARHDVAQAAADANASVTRSIAATGRSALGANLAGQLDGFRAAVDQFAPLIILNDLTAPIDADSLPPAAGQVRVTALALGDAVLSELDGLLADRDTDLGRQRQVTIGAAIAFAVAVALSVWLVLSLIRTARRGRPEADAVPAREPGERAPDDLVDVHRLLDLEELAGSGRAAGARPPGSADHAR